MVYSHLLRIFGDSRCISRGKMVHGKLIASGFPLDLITGNHLAAMYAKCGHMDDARQVFDRMPERNVVSWTVLISGYSQQGLAENALESFRLMVSGGLEPNHFTFVAIFSACSIVGAAKAGKEIHGKVYRIDHGSNTFVSNALVNLYAKCGLLEYAHRVFDEILQPNYVSWTSLISGYYQCGENAEGLRIFSESRKVGVKANEFTYTSVLGACAGLANYETGEQIHGEIIKLGIESDIFVGTGIIDFYAKCSKLDSAHRVFSRLNEPSLSSWAALIGGYGQQGQEEKAINLFFKFWLSGLKPNEHIISSVLVACANIFAFEVGKQLHSLILKSGLKLVTFVGNAVIDLYAKCRFLDDSCKVFEEMIERDIVSWNILIAGHVRNGNHMEAIKLLNQMLISNIDPNPFTYSSILSLCGDLPATEWGRQIHGIVTKPGFHSDVVVRSALVDMYSKCGRLREALHVFNNMTVKNMVSWNTILVAYAQHGFGKEALEIFDQMQRLGVKPNEITFIGVLSACVHVGLIENCFRYLNSMIKEHGIIPRVDHYACIVDLLARAGKIERAYDFISRMPFEPDIVIWRSLLASCRTHKNLDLGKVAAESILRIDPGDASAHVMLSNIYSDYAMWEKATEVRKAMKEKGLKKEPGSSWIEMKDKIHAFVIGDEAHSQIKEIHEIVNGLTIQMLDMGYLPDTLILDHGEFGE